MCEHLQDHSLDWMMIAGLIAASSHNPVSAVAGAQEEEEEDLPASQLDSESSNAENTAPGMLKSSSLMLLSVMICMKGTKATGTYFAHK